MFFCCTTNCSKPSDTDLEIKDQKATLFSHNCEEFLPPLEQEYLPQKATLFSHNCEERECLPPPGGLPFSGSSLKEPEATKILAPSRTQLQTIEKPAAKKAASFAGAKRVKAEAGWNAAEHKAKVDKLQVEAQAEVKQRNAQAELKQRNFSAAVDLFSAAINLNAESAVAWAGRGRARLLTSSLNEALSDLSEAIRLDDNLVSAFRDRAEVKSLLGDLDGSIADSTKYLNLLPCDGRALHLRGSTKLRQGNKEEAEKDFAFARRLGYSGAVPTSGGA